MTIKIRGHHFDAFNVAVVIALIVWAAFQVFVPLAQRPPALDQAFMTVLGGWVTNKAMEQRKKEDRISDKVERLTEAVTTSERRADTSELRADEAERREAQRDSGQGDGP